jgi:hypothetical protein
MKKGPGLPGPLFLRQAGTATSTPPSDIVPMYDFLHFPIVHFSWLGSAKAWTPGQPQPRVKS